MLSRIADSLFWLNRYMERADGMLRLAATHYILSLDKDINGTITWKPVLEIFTPATEKEIAAMENNTEEVLKTLLVESRNPNSLKLLINKARENARGAQDHITKEVWEEVNQMYHLVNQPSIVDQLNMFQGLEVMEPLIKHTVMYTGITEITMPRGTGWCFMNLGKFVERCLQTIVFTEKQMEVMNFSENEMNDILEWRYLLFSLSGYELHLKTYRSSNYNYNVLHQVLINQNFTRSVVYSLSQMEYFLKTIIAANDHADNENLLRSFGKLYSKVQYLEMDDMNNASIQAFLAEIKTGLSDFNRKLVQQFFSYS